MRIPDTCVMELDSMEFHSCHGCFEKERAEGNRFLVDFKGEVPLKKCAKSDRLEDALDYGEIFKLVREEMDKPSNLLENVAWRIVARIHGAFPDIYPFAVRVSKQNPPVGGSCEWSRITVKYPDTDGCGLHF